MADQQIVIVGAGPAGVRAAERLAGAGLRPVVIDDAATAGGQIYRRPPPPLQRGARALYGDDASKAAALFSAFERLRDKIDYRPKTTVWGLSEKQLFAQHSGVSETIRFSHLILATGATDRVMPVPGWTAPGVYTLGGAQIALKTQGVAAGSPMAFLGSGPLLTLVAYQYAKAGAPVAAVLDTARLSDSVAALPQLSARPMLLMRGLRMRAALWRLGVPVHLGARPIEILADEGGVSGVAWLDAAGLRRETAAGGVGIGWHLRSETQLADLAGCALAFDPIHQQWRPKLDAMGRSSQADVYVAGDGADLCGADGAETTGALAALSVLQDLGRETDSQEIRRLLRRRARLDRFARGLARAFPWPSEICGAIADDVVLCRCEAVTAGAFRAALARHGVTELNRAKSLSRVGMGRCQGRYCAAAADILAAANGCEASAAGRLRTQAPIKPIAMGEKPPPSAVG